MSPEKEFLWRLDRKEFIRRCIRGEGPPTENSERRRRSVKSPQFGASEIDIAAQDRMRDVLDAVARVRDLNAVEVGHQVRKALVTHLASLKRSAALRRLRFDLTDEEAVEMMKSPCAYCGLVEEHAFNGIDRVYSDTGYTPENSVPCCRWCNHAKGQRSVRDFLGWIEWVATNTHRLRFEKETARKTA